jgi:1,2-phenylacetyl-CoA epoxidase catalytic subunit
MYFRGKKREALLADYKKSNRKRYSKFRSFRGTFARVLPKIIDEVVYDRKKDKAILELMPAEKEKDRGQEKLDKLKLKVFNLSKVFNLKQKDIAKALGENPTHFSEWKKLNKEELPIPGSFN